VVEVDVTSIAGCGRRPRPSSRRARAQALVHAVLREGAVDALKAHPSLNAGIDTEKGEITYYDRENLAIAVDTERAC
jgi:2-oxoglutarate dehydrogenase E2 component (dihydrolipoamide succinyltransferase)